MLTRYTHSNKNQSYEINNKLVRKNTLAQNLNSGILLCKLDNLSLEKMNSKGAATVCSGAVPIFLTLLPYFANLLNFARSLTKFKGIPVSSKQL